jgi:membrane-associated phospholipid phosphatase
VRPIRSGDGDSWVVPVLEPRRDGVSSRLARSFESMHPILAFVVVVLGGFAVIAGLSILFGLLVVHVIEPSLGIGAADERVNGWLANHRTPTRTHASLIGSIVGGGVVLPIIATVWALLFAALRRWRLAAYTAFALLVESGTYRATTLVVHAHRPRVARLEQLPVNASYPSGHTAAAIAVYAGIALLLTSKFHVTALRTVAWLVAFAMVVFVATSRMYRGMHHPLDVAGGIAVGIMALCVVITACRVARAVADTRAARGRIQ